MRINRLIAQGMPTELVDLANARLVSINAAYEEIQTLNELK